jgi:hypothetical protein
MHEGRSPPPSFSPGPVPSFFFLFLPSFFLFFKRERHIYHVSIISIVHLSLRPSDSLAPAHDLHAPLPPPQPRFCSHGWSSAFPFHFLWISVVGILFLLMESPISNYIFKSCIYQAYFSGYLPHLMPWWWSFMASLI